MAESKPHETTDLPHGHHPASPPAKEVNQPAKGPATSAPEPRNIERVEHTEVVRSGDVRQAAAQDKAAARSAARDQQAERMRERDNMRPTPTQEENDLIAMGLPVDEVGHAPSGAPPDRYPSRTAFPHHAGVPEETRTMAPERQPGDGYKTR
jgi:hypothetical protein